MIFVVFILPSQGSVAQEPILRSARSMLDSSTQLLKSARSLILNPKDPPTWSVLAGHSRTVSDSIKSLITAIRFVHFSAFFFFFTVEITKEISYFFMLTLAVSEVQILTVNYQIHTHRGLSIPTVPLTSVARSTKGQNWLSDLSIAVALANHGCL